MTTQTDNGQAVADKPAISVKSLDFYYGEHKALRNISMDFARRKVTGMIGPSGCGKSTLLRVLNRMYDLYPGQRATLTGCAPGWAWSSRNRRRSRCRSMTTSPSA